MRPFPHMTAEAFRTACARFATGVAIATVIGADGLPHGMTVNSFTSVSLDPPLILLCVDRGCTLLPTFCSATYFAMNFLTETQTQLSSKFAIKGHDRFDGIPWTAGRHGAPLLPEALASLECRKLREIEAGDHTIVIAQVEEVAIHQGRPLIFFNSAYRELS